MEESIQLDAGNEAALNTYGHYLMNKGDPRGMQFVEKACNLLSDELASGGLPEQDFSRLHQAASTLGKRRVLERLRAYREEHGADEVLFSEEYLVAGSDRNALKNEG